MIRYVTLQTAAKFALILAVIVVVQGILSLKFQVFAYFDLPLIYSVYYGFTLANPVGSIAVGTTVGLMQDSLAGLPLGMNGFSKTLISFLSAVTGSKFDVDQTVTRVFALVLFTFLDFMLKVMLNSVVGSASLMSPPLATWVLSAVFNTLLGLVLFGFRGRRNATA